MPCVHKYILSFPHSFPLFLFISYLEMDQHHQEPIVRIVEQLVRNKTKKHVGKHIGH